MDLPPYEDDPLISPLNNVNTNQILPSHLLGRKGSTTGYEALPTTSSIDPAPSSPLLSLF